MYFLTGVQLLSTEIEGGQTYILSKTFLEMSNIFDWSNIPFPEPLGPVIIWENGNLDATSYVDCLNS